MTEQFEFKAGQRVVTRGNDVYMVMPNTMPVNVVEHPLLFVSKTGFNYATFEEYEDYPEYDVMEVYAPPGPSALLDLSRRGELLWKRASPEVAAKRKLLENLKNEIIKLEEELANV